MDFWQGKSGWANLAAPVCVLRSLNAQPMAQWYSPPAQARKQTVEVAREFESREALFLKWAIDEHPKNRRLGIAIDEHLSKIVSSITHFE